MLLNARPPASAPGPEEGPAPPERQGKRKPVGTLCGICGKNFARTDHLKRHVATVHENRKDFECPRCDQKFGKKDII